MPFISLKAFGPFSVGLQAVLMLILWGLLIFFGFQDLAATGLVFGYAFSWLIFFGPFFEEVVFRGLMLWELQKHLSDRWSIVLSSLIFGLWHFKNSAYLLSHEVIYQVLYTGLIFAPLAAFLTLKNRAIGMAILLHLVNNLLAYASSDLTKELSLLFFG